MSNPEWLRVNEGWIVAAILFFGQLVWFASRVWYQVKQHVKSLEGLGEQTVGGRIDREVNGLGQRIDREVNRINREVNGLGQRINELKKEADARYRALSFALLVLCPPEKREAISQLLQKCKWL